jgi:hypothetical protein
MKTITTIILGLCVALFPTEGGEAAAFENLGFENVDLSHLSSTNVANGVLMGVGTVSDLLPGWALTDGKGVRRTFMVYNAFPVGSNEAVLWENAHLSRPYFADGKYSLALYALGSFKVSQTGDVPIGMNGLMLLRGPQGFGDPLTVSMNGEILNVLRAQGSTNVVYDVSKFAGRTVDLDLTVWQLQFPHDDSALLGSLAFVVPEPSVVTLIVLSVVVLLVTHVTARRQRHS